MRRAKITTQSDEAAFSLFEIVVAMAILGMISTAVLSVLWQTGDTAAELRYLDRRDEEVNRFVGLLRESIEGLPPDATISMSPAESSESGNYEFKLENTPTAFVFGETIGSCEEAFIAMRPEGGDDMGAATFELALSRNDFFPEDTDGSGMAIRSGGEGDLVPDAQDRYWMPLLSGIGGAMWRYWDDAEQEWLEEWTDPEAMPALLEFTLIATPGGRAQRFVFEVPNRLVDPEEEVAEPASVSSSSDRSSSGDGDASSGPSGGGGGDQSAQPGGGRPGDGRPGGRPGAGPGGGRGPDGRPGRGGGGPRGPGGGQGGGAIGPGGGATGGGGQ